MANDDLESLYNSKYYQFEEFGFRNEKRATFILSYLNIKSTDKVLEIGCGLGVLLKKVPSKHKIGIETNDTAVRACKKRGLSVIKADAEKGLFFDNSSFDIVIMHEVIEHLHRPELVMKECFRVLSPKGKILITTPARNFFFHDLSPTHFSEMTTKGLKELVEKCGFRLLIHEVCGISFLYPLLENFLFKPFRFFRYIFLIRNNKGVVEWTDSCHSIADKTFLKPLSAYRKKFLGLGLNQLILAQKKG